MWEEFKESYIDDSGTEWCHRGIRRKDGFTLLESYVGWYDEPHQAFTCMGNFDEFSFYAFRWNAFKQQSTDTYIVLLGGTPHKGHPNRRKVDKETRRKLVLKYAKDIESALLSFPPNAIFKAPVNEVLFDISRDLHTRKLIRAVQIV